MNEFTSGMKVTTEDYTNPEKYSGEALIQNILNEMKANPKITSNPTASCLLESLAHKILECNRNQRNN